MEERRAVSCEEMRAIDRRAQEEFGIPQETLMENAGKAVAEESLKILGEIRPAGARPKALLFCGGGNNGGDGLVAARILHERKIDVKVFLFRPAASLTGAALDNLKKLKNLNIPYEELPETDKIKAETKDCDLLVDALLGTGIKNEVTGLYKEALEAMNASKKPLVAVDVPSGMDADTGIPLGICARARLTVTMGAAKIGFLKNSAEKWTGKIVIADIGFPKELFERR